MAMLAASLAIFACSRSTNDLSAYVAKVKSAEPSGIAPMPEVKPYASFEYQAEHLRDPFDAAILTPQLTQQIQNNDNKLLPNPNRPLEFLEGFPLDSLRMVGTLEQQGMRWVLIKTPDKILQRVTRGNYMGQNHGRITAISDVDVMLHELVSNGFGGWQERENRIALSE